LFYESNKKSCEKSSVFLLFNNKHLNLAIDIGNSLLKIGLFKNNICINYYEFDKDYHNNVKNILESNTILNSIVSNVSDSNKEIIELLSVKTKLIKIDSLLKIPFKNNYKTKSTLGQDRLVLVSSAAKQFPNNNVLIIDLGSCITYDFISVENEYIGGAISPGLNMRYKALNSFTANLPLLNPKKIDDRIGENTEDSIHSGVVNGIIFEINGTVDYYKSEFKEIRIILTGGDSKFLFKKIKNSIFANSNFLLLGLNYLIELNKK
jgi:type III pantothenate kinase